MANVRAWWGSKGLNDKHTHTRLLTSAVKGKSYDYWISSLVIHGSCGLHSGLQQVWVLISGVLLTLPWFEFLEISTGIGSNSSSLPFSPHDMRKAESAVKEEEVKEWWRGKDVNSIKEKRRKKGGCKKIKNRWSQSSQHLKAMHFRWLLALGYKWVKGLLMLLFIVPL